LSEIAWFRQLSIEEDFLVAKDDPGDNRSLDCEPRQEKHACHAYSEKPELGLASGFSC